MQKSMLRILSLADLLSISNGLFGFFSIIILLSNTVSDISLRIHISFSLILLGLLADGLDGIVARRFGKSEIGEYLESMADVTTLVIAPSIFVYFIYLELVTINISKHIYLLFAIFLFVFFGFVRLASFSIMKEKKLFVGLPASVSTIIILVLSYVKIEFLLILPAVVIIGAAMASNLTFPKPNRYIDSIAAFLILLSIIFGSFFYNIFPIFLLSGIFIYSILGPFLKEFFTKKQQKGF